MNWYKNCCAIIPRENISELETNVEKNLSLLITQTMGTNLFNIEALILYKSVILMTN